MKINKKFLKSQAGFTLVELLVVIAIIGILASVVSLSVVKSIKDSRDGSRISDIHSIESALEMYYNQEKVYPEIYTTYPGTRKATGSQETSEISTSTYFLSPLWNNDYLKEKPTDPTNNSTYNYKYQIFRQDVAAGIYSNPQKYYVSAAMESKNQGENIFSYCDGTGTTWDRYYYMRFSSYSYRTAKTLESTCVQNCSAPCYKPTW